MPQTRTDFEQNGENGFFSGLANDFLGTNNRGDYEGRLKEYLDQYQNRQAPQAGANASQSYNSGFRQNQSDLVGRLEALSQGRGPSLAAEQLKQATGRNMAQQSSIAASGRGNAGMAGIMAANTSGQLGAQAAGQSAVARIQEQQMALSQLGSVLGQARGADETNSQFNAQQQNFRDQANLEAKLRTMGLNDSQISNILQQLGTQVNKPSMGEKILAGLTGGGGQAVAGMGSTPPAK